MAQVPYSPVPNVVPTTQPVRPLQINTPPAAFGVTVAEAEKGLGQTAEGAGDQLAARAEAIKGLQNETWAKGAFVDASAKVGEKDAQFYALKGQNAVNARPQYEADIRQIYTDSMNNAPSLQARSMLGDALARRISYSIDDGQKHAGQQQLEAMNAVSDARVSDALATAELHPDNDNLFNQGLATIRTEAIHRAQHAGTPETADENIRKWSGEAWKGRLNTLAFNDPMHAQEVYNANKDAIDATGVNPQGIPYSTLIKENIQQRMDVVGTSQVADQIIAQTLYPDDIKPSDIKVDAQGNEIPQDSAAAWKATGPEFLSKALEAADKWARDNGSTTQFQSLLENRIRETYNIHHDAVRQAEYGQFLGVYGAVLGANGGQRITSMDSIYNNPVLNEQYQQLLKDSPGRAHQIETIVNNAFKQGTMDPMEASNVYHTLLGKAYEAERNSDARDAFTQLDMSQYQGRLPQSMVNDLFKHQQQVANVWAKKAEADNHLETAMGFLRPTLKQLGIEPSATNPQANDLYSMFEGAMYEQLTKAEQEKGTPIRDQAEIMKMAQPILQSVAQGSNAISRWWYGNIPVYQPSEAARTTLTNNFKTRYGYEPSAFQVGQMYMKALSLPKGNPQRKELGLD